MNFLLNYDLNPNLEGNNGFSRQPANYNGNAIAIYNTQLAATTDKSVVVPSAVGAGRALNANPKVLAIFSYQASATVFVAVATATNGVTTAAPDTSGTLTAGVSFINPTALLLTGGDIIHMYPGAQAFVSVEFYSIS
jgi:hypothetical protein